MSAQLDDGFYACEEWPLWFKIHTLHGVPNIWGFSIWKNVPGYRTLGIPFREWRERHKDNLKIYKDHDRTQDKEFLRFYRRMSKEARRAARD